MAAIMMEKFDKYQGQVNGALAIATILDPRNKMDCGDYYFRRIYNEGADIELERVKRMLDDLVIEYQRNNDHEQVSSKLPLQGSLKRKSPITFDYGEEDEFAPLKKTKMRRVNVKCELDHYLEEDPLPDHDDLMFFAFGKKIASAQL